MKYFKIAAVLLSLLILLTACEETTSPKRYTEDYYVISGLLYSNQKVTPENGIFIGKSIDADGGNIENAFVNPDSIQVFLEEIDSGLQVELAPYVYIDSTSASLTYYDPGESLIIKSGKSYKIEARINNFGKIDTVWSETTVPDSVQIVENTAFVDYLPETEEGFPTANYDTAGEENPLKIKTYDSDNLVLYFEFYCLEDFEDAYYIEDYPGVGDQPEEQEEYEDPITGNPRKIEYYAEYQPHEEDGEYFVTDSSYTTNFIFWGRYRIKAYTIDDNYYSYLYKPEGYNFGGINNGIGYFGSVSGNTLYTKVTE